jgi:SpoIVB peptidase S55
MLSGPLTRPHRSAPCPENANAEFASRTSHTHQGVVALSRNLKNGSAYHKREFGPLNWLRRFPAKLLDIVSAHYRPFRMPPSVSFRAAAQFLLLCAMISSAKGQGFFPLRDVHPGLQGVGRTVFTGGEIEEFQVHILGVLENPGPRQAIILARLSGGPLAETGVQQGMSGSPVYIDGKLLGAVALGFPFSKEPIAGIQPIQEMIADANGEAADLGSRVEFKPPVMNSWRFHGMRLLRGAGSDSKKEDIDQGVATPYGALSKLLIPLSFSGFGPAATEALADEFRGLGFGPMAGISSQATPGANPPALKMASRAEAAAAVKPGSMVSVGLLTGDMNITADGTVTFVDGSKVYAFGHRFLNTGSTELPFAHSEVLAVVPSLSSSFKLSVPREWAGTMLSDRTTGISGEIGRLAHTVPLSVTVHSTATGTHRYHFQIVNDRFLTPFIMQAALFSVLDATERALGRGTVQLSGQADWEGNLPPLEMRDTFVTDSGLAQQVAVDAVVPLAFVLGGGFQSAKLKQVTFNLEANESKQELRVAQAWASRHEVRPGDSLEITALLEGENGIEMSRSLTYHVPPGAPAGPLNFTVSDGNTLNFPEFAGLAQSSSRTPAELIQTINAFRDSDAVYLRVWRQQPFYTVGGPSPFGELTDPPPSAALILADPSDSATSNAALTVTRGSQMAELSARIAGYVVSGAKTLQVEVKE